VTSAGSRSVGTVHYEGHTIEPAWVVERLASGEWTDEQFLAWGRPLDEATRAVAP